MEVTLVRAMRNDVNEYIRIGRLVISRFNTVATNPDDVLKELEESIVQLIRVDGRVIGFISYKIPAAWKHAYISEVQVEPDFQGRGIGGQALAMVLEAFSTFEVVDLHTHPQNPAQRMYARHGFVATGEIIENYEDTGEPRMRMLLKRP